MQYIKVWIYDVVLMTYVLFLVCYPVLCVLANDPGTSMVNTKTQILLGSVGTIAAAHPIVCVVILPESEHQRYPHP